MLWANTLSTASEIYFSAFQQGIIKEKRKLFMASSFSLAPIIKHPDPSGEEGMNHFPLY